MAVGRPLSTAYSAGRPVRVVEISAMAVPPSSFFDEFLWIVEKLADFAIFVSGKFQMLAKILPGERVTKRNIFRLV